MVQGDPVMLGESLPTLHFRLEDASGNQAKLNADCILRTASEVFEQTADSSWAVHGLTVSFQQVRARCANLVQRQKYYNKGSLVVRDDGGMKI